MNNFKTTDWLNLRNDPFVPADMNSNVIAVLPPGKVVERLPDLNTDHWFHIKTFLGNKEAKGFVSTNYLQQAPNELVEAETINEVKVEANLDPAGKMIRRNETGGRAFALNEPGSEQVDISDTTPTEAISRIYKVINWLDVEHSKRYAPTNANTYCNIYAFDVAHGCKKYIPRVWWTEKALTQIRKGGKLNAVYEQTVTELNANALTNWFEDYGESFGWKRILDVDTLQQEVNKGKLGIIVAQRINLNRSGHIVAVIPETPGNKAQRDGNNKITSPLQSQAGVTNKKIFTGNNWWVNSNKFRKFGLWVI